MFLLSPKVYSDFIPTEVKTVSDWVNRMSVKHQAVEDWWRGTEEPSGSF